MILRTDQRIVDVNVQPRSYRVIIAPGGLATLGDELRKQVHTDQAGVVTDDNVGPRYADKARQALESAGFRVTVITVPAGDATKSLQHLSNVYDQLAAARFDRTAPLIALGGGVIGDLTGFAAATWLRGVPFVQCPTTLEADVDASVGGKTGVNHTSGKNMIGAFYQPRFVLIDTNTLDTLSERDVRAGLAESVKHAMIRDAEFFDWHEANADAVRTCDQSVRVELVARNVAIKAAVVQEDEREVSGVRAVLNFGHTVGHAIETAMSRRGDTWRHGEAIAVGMVAAAEMSVVAGRLDRAAAERLITLIGRINLPTQAPLADARDELMSLMQSDKKVAGNKIRFVLADAVGRATLYDDIQPAWINAGLDRVLT